MDEQADDRTIGQALNDGTDGEGASRRANGTETCTHTDTHTRTEALGLVHPSDGGGWEGFHF